MTNQNAAIVHDACKLFVNISEPRGDLRKVGFADSAEASVVVEDGVVGSDELLQHGFALHVHHSDASDLAADCRVNLNTVKHVVDKLQPQLKVENDVKGDEPFRSRVNIRHSFRPQRQVRASS